MHSLLVFVSFGAALLMANAWAQSLDPIVHMCSRWHHQSAIKNNILYIDGGIETFNYSNKILGYNQYFLEVDMSDSWDWKTNISERRIQKSQNSATGTYPPSLVRGALFQGPLNGSKIYTYGGTSFLANTSFPGWEGPDADAYAMWSYDTAAQTWEQYDVTTASPKRPNRGAYAEAAGLGLAFWLNGQVDQGSSVVTNAAGMVNRTTYLEGMIVLNTVDQTARNVSTVSLGSPRVAGGLQYLEGVGENGALVAVGGMKSVQFGASNETNGVLINFESVDLCDDFGTGNSTWYAQPTSGDIPAPRTDFCLVTVSAPDNSSHNIYLYGGYDPSNGTMFDDMYALSLPSFTWTHVYGPGESPRWGHTCHLVGKRQMLTVGGSLDASPYQVETTQQPLEVSALQCDWESKGVGIYDLSTLQWGSVFNAYGQPYQVPNVIVKVVGGTKNGNATMTAPKNGFAQTAVSSMFARATATVSSGPMPELTGSTQKAKRINAGAVAGGVIGGLIGLALIIWLIVRTLRKDTLQALRPKWIPELDQKPSRQEMGIKGPTPELRGVPRHEMSGRDRPVEMAENQRPPVELLGSSNFANDGGIHDG